MEKKMKKVEIYSNWCESDSLNDIILRDGEKIRVQWFDGTITEEQVTIMCSSYNVSDHGSIYAVPIDKAYIQVFYKGIPALIRLAGTELLCERVASVKPVKEKRTKFSKLSPKANGKRKTDL